MLRLPLNPSVFVVLWTSSCRRRRRRRPRCLLSSSLRQHLIVADVVQTQILPLTRPVTCSLYSSTAYRQPQEKPQDRLGRDSGDLLPFTRRHSKLYLSLSRTHAPANNQHIRHLKTTGVLSFARLTANSANQSMYLLTAMTK